MPCVSASVARSRSVGWLTAPSPRRRRQNASFIPDSAGPGRTSATAATVSSSVRASSIRNRCRIAGDSSWKQFSVSPAAIAAEAIASSSAIAPRSMALGSGPPAEEGYVAAEVGATGGSEQAASRGSRETGTGGASRKPSEWGGAGGGGEAGGVEDRALGAPGERGDRATRAKRGGAGGRVARGGRPPVPN